MPPRPHRYFNNFAPTKEGIHHIAHWSQGEVPCFVTWRLADSIPVGLRSQWRNERETWLRHHPEPWDSATEKEYHSRFSKRIQEWLDQGMGSCVLRSAQNAEIVGKALRFFEGERCEIDSFVVMPNHVHVLFTPIQPHSVSDLVKSWKAYTGRQINLALKREGPLWQDEYWDRLIRSEEHLHACRVYIQRNPEKAGLRDGEFIFYRRVTE